MHKIDAFKIPRKLFPMLQPLTLNFWRHLIKYHYR